MSHPPMNWGPAHPAYVDQVAKRARERELAELLEAIRTSPTDNHDPGDEDRR